MEIPQVNIASVVRLTSPPPFRASGYVLFPLLLWTAHIGGVYSKWVVAHTSYVTRVAVFTIAPVALLIAVYSRVR